MMSWEDHFTLPEGGSERSVRVSGEGNPSRRWEVGGGNWEPAAVADHCRDATFTLLTSNFLVPLPASSFLLRDRPGGRVNFFNARRGPSVNLISRFLRVCGSTRWLCCLVAVCLITCHASAQDSTVTIGQTVRHEVHEIYARGLQFLKAKQNERGTWDAGEGSGPGTTGLAVLAFLASGEDPNHGPYRDVIRGGLRHMITRQNEKTGYMGPSMYHHGFATLALGEAYGVVDDRRLFRTDETNGRSIADALELAVRAALTAQNRNRFGAWRYSPNASDADTSVSGSVMMGLLGARNAGIEVPDESVDRAIEYFEKMTSPNGGVGYSSFSDGGGESLARSSIVNLVLAIAGRKDLKAYEVTGQYIIANQNVESTWPEYARYYQAQAMFQTDFEAWERWNDRLIRRLKREQKSDGSFDGDLGIINSTSMNLLTLAVNFRFLPIYER